MPSLVSLDAATGAVRYRVKLDNQELRSLVVTTSGVAAVLTLGDTVKTYDLSAGKHLWSRAYRKDTGLLADGGLLIIDAKQADSSPTTLQRRRALRAHAVDKDRPAGLLRRADRPQWHHFRLQDEPDPAAAAEEADDLPRPRAVRGYRQDPVDAAHRQPGHRHLAVAGSASPSRPGYPGSVYVKDPTARLYLASLATGKVR